MTSDTAKAQVNQYPFYFKSTIVLLGLVVLTYALSALQGILVPFSFALIIAVLLNPLYVLFLRFRLPRIPAIILTLITAYVIVGIIVFLLSLQMLHFGETFPVLKIKLIHFFDELRQGLKARFGLSMAKQDELITEVGNNSKTLIASTVGSALSMLSLLVLIPVYVFMLLFYKTLVLNFLFEVFAEENSQHVRVILNQTKQAIQSYMIGLLLEACIVAILNSVGLLILGLNYAILIGVMGAILNMLPYIGGIIAIAIPLLIATVTKDGYGTQIGVIISFTLVQFIDNHILIPRVVSSKVQINGLVTIIFVLMAGALWGVGGMFLAIPFIAVLKIIFDRVDNLRPWGKLLGDIVPSRHKGDIWRRRKQEAALTDKITT